MDRACAETDPEIFFPEKYTAAAIRPAVAICNSCPIKQQCAQTFWYEKYGIFGGLVPRERSGHYKDPGMSGAEKRKRKR